MLVGLGQTAHADMSVSQSNDPTAALGVNLVSLFSQEKAGLDAVEAGRMNEILTPPVKVEKTSAGKTVPQTYDAAWVQAIQPVAQTAESECLARAIYFESRGESIKGQAAVAEVVLNRVAAPSFPKSICGVVNQANSGGCQFSFTCDGRKDSIGDRTAWYVAEQIASAYIGGAPRNLTDGATYFHTPASRPDWSRRFDMTVRIGSHYFYRPPIVTAMN